jgi:hypothetical protein
VSTRVGRPFGYALLAGSLGACVVWLGPPGTDLAAHVYQRAFFLKSGFTLWNNYWYAGRYSFVTYSVLYYPLAAVVGIKLLATASVAAGAGAFGLIVEREWGRVARWAAWAFAVALATSVVSAAFPYVLGVAFALVALAALQSRRFKTFGGFVAAAFCASPLAFVLLLVVLAAALARSRRLLVKAVVPVAAIAFVAGVLWRLFPGSGRFPFSFAELVAALLFCAAGIVFSWRVERARLLLYVFAVYAGFCLLCYVIPSEIGANIVRLRFVAVPIMALTLSLRRWKPLLPGLAVFGLALAWNVTPLAYSYARGAADPSSLQGFWAPAIGFLRGHASPSYRVEAVDTTGHWEADYLPAAGIPLVRGWFRQDDFPNNALLYDPTLARASYVRWLRKLAVRYVVLTTAPADYSSQSEALLLRSGRSGLPVVFRGTDITIFAVPSPEPIVTGPGRPRVVTMRDSSMTIDVQRAGTYRLALRYTPYWSAPGACIAQTNDGMISLHARRAGRIQLNFAVTASDALTTLLGADTQCRALTPAGASFRHGAGSRSLHHRLIG